MEVPWLISPKQAVRAVILTATRGNTYVGLGWLAVGLVSWLLGQLVGLLGSSVGLVCWLLGWVGRLVGSVGMLVMLCVVLGWFLVCWVGYLGWLISW